jgi:hypothetical protein
MDNGDTMPHRSNSVLASSSVVYELPKLKQVPSWCHSKRLIMSCDNAHMSLYEKDISLVTQCSVDRLPQLTEQALNWNGILSVAIYIHDYELFINNGTAAMIQSFIRYLDDYAIIPADDTKQQSLPSQSCRMVVSLMIANDVKEEYPINSLRNLAVSQSPTNLVGSPNNRLLFHFSSSPPSHLLLPSLFSMCVLGIGKARCCCWMLISW